MQENFVLNDIVQNISLSMGAAWASGLNLYATIAVLGIMGATGNMALPPELQILTAPGVIFASIVMYVVEFIADKVPAFDTAWDSVHTFIRIPAGAILAAEAMGPVSQEAMLVAGILGGGLAAGTHATKAGARVLINASPEPVTNWVASITEDVAVIAGLWTALTYPWVFLMLLGLFVILMAWLLPKIWRGVVKLFRTIARWFTGAPTPAAPAPPPPPPGAVTSGVSVTAASSATPPAASAAPVSSRQSDVRVRLDELDALRREGRLEEAEYKALRAKVLESL